MSNSLIYGKAQITNIVSAESEKGTTTLFIEKDGVITTKEIPHKYWLLCNERLDLTWFRLEGDQHYCWGKQFPDYWKLRAEKEKYEGKDFYAINNPTEAAMVKDGFSYYQGMQPSDVSILAFDIETNGFAHDENSRVYLISNTLRVNGEIERKLFAHDEYENDGQMIEDWCNWVRSVDPSILCGHNIYAFDFPFLIHTASLFKKRLNLGRNDSNIRVQRNESKYRVDGSRDLHYFKVQVYGREICDTMFLAYKYDIGRKYESYGLKAIIKQEGLEKKDRTFFDAGTIKDKVHIPEEWAKIKQYAIEDGDDALSLFDLMAPVVFYLCQVVPKPFQAMIESASGSQINAVMVRSYLQEKHSIAKASVAEEFQGAISFAVPGIYSNMLKIDFSALYPSIMMQYEVYDKEKDPNKNFVKVVNYFAENRQHYKQLYIETKDVKYDYLQQVAKVIANSCYGFLGASGLNYNAPKEAAFITTKGRELLQQTIEWATNKKTEYWLELFAEKTK